MAVVVMLKIPGADSESAALFAELVKQELDGREMADSQLLYLGGPSHGAWCMVEVWESQEALERWRSGGLANVIRRAGFMSVVPEVTAFEASTFMQAP